MVLFIHDIQTPGRPITNVIMFRISSSVAINQAMPIGWLDELPTSDDCSQIVSALVNIACFNGLFYDVGLQNFILISWRRASCQSVI